MKKIYLKPLAEFEEIEGLDTLLDEDSKWKYNTEGETTTTDFGTEVIDWGGGTEGGGDDDPNG